MAIIYDYTKKDNVLHVEAAGTGDSLEESINYVVRVKNIALEYNCQKILFDEQKLFYTLEDIELYQSVEFMVQNVPNNMKIAVVVHPEQKSEGDFWETMALNRGLYVKVCEDTDIALQWLNSSS